MILSCVLYSCAFCEPLTNITLIFKPFVLSEIEIMKYEVCNNTSVFASNNIENFVFLPTKIIITAWFTNINSIFVLLISVFTYECITFPWYLHHLNVAIHSPKI